MGRYDEAIAEAKRAEELERLVHQHSHLVGILYLQAVTTSNCALQELLDVESDFFPGGDTWDGYEQKDVR